MTTMTKTPARTKPSATARLAKERKRLEDAADRANAKVDEFAALGREARRAAIEAEAEARYALSFDEKNRLLAKCDFYDSEGRHDGSERNIDLTPTAPAAEIAFRQARLRLAQLELDFAVAIAELEAAEAAVQRVAAE